MKISVIIPVYNGAGTLPQCLTALTQAQPAPDEIIVVDDGSKDHSAELAREWAVRVIRLEQNIGAAAAKNRGAAQARGEVLFFTDSDILVPPDIFAKVAACLADESLDGVVGLLDPHIPAQDFASQFKNLWMHFTYARFTGASRIGLFYTSVAAIRRERFTESGGFDEQYRGASIAEDTELGQRLWARGLSIRLAPNIRVIHLKTYSVGSVLREDYRRARALTLMRLRKWGQPFFTSVPLFYQLALPVINAALGALMLSIILRGTSWLWLALVALLIFYALNASWLAFLAQARGFRFAIQSAIFLPFDVLAVGLGMLAALWDFARGIRY